MTYNSMDVQIHNLEQEAYCAVLRAFKAQSDALSWDKESLITELRKELGVSDDEHRELLSRVNSDDVIRRIRESRQDVPQVATLGSSHPIHEVLPSPTFSHKKRKTSVQSLPMHYSSPVHTMSKQFNSQYISIPLANAPGEAESLIGRQGRHALAYDIHPENETWEWVNFKEISPMDIRGEEDPAITHHTSIIGLGHGYKRLSGPGPVQGRGRMMARNKYYLPMQNGAERKLPDDVELFDTELLVKEVERVFDANQPDPALVAKAKKLLKEHEQALVDAIARLGEASDGESDDQPTHLLGRQLIGH